MNINKNSVRYSSGRKYCFYLDSYLTEGQILKVLFEHRNQIRVYAYAYHDKDVYSTNDPRAGELKEPHYHILLITYTNHTLSAVRRWFYGFYDDNGQQVNTLGQIGIDKYTCYDYLTHSDRDSIAKGKYLYSDDIVKCNDREFFMGHEKAEYDVSTQIIDSLLAGVDYKTLRKRFGKNFILNFHTYKNYAFEESVNERFDIEGEWTRNAKRQRELNEDLF